MYQNFQEFLTKELQEIKNAGLWKNEREITSPQNSNISVKEDKVLNFCANNYLGLANNPRLIAAAKKAMDERGYGMASVPRRAGRHHLRCPQPRLYHRRSTSVQGTAFPLRQRRYGRLGGSACGCKGLPIQTDSYRRCILYGRQRGSAR